MSMMSIVLRLWSWGFWAWHTVHGPYLFSRAVRALFEPKRRYPTALPLYGDVTILSTVLQGLVWKGDRWGGALDVISRPERVQDIIDKARGFVERIAPTLDEARMQGNLQAAQAEARAIYFTKVKSLDCDDFAIYAANTLPPDRTPLFVSVNWADAEGKGHGHAICCFRTPGHAQAWAAISNQHHCEPQSADSLEGCVKSLVGGGQLVGYAVASPALDFHSVHRSFSA